MNATNSNPQSGMSLVSVMVATGLMAMLAVGAASFWRGQVRSMTEVQRRGEIEQLKRMISNQMSCRRTLLASDNQPIPYWDQANKSWPQGCFSSANNPIPAFEPKNRLGQSISPGLQPVVGKWRFWASCVPAAGPKPTRIKITALMCGKDCLDNPAKDAAGRPLVIDDLMPNNALCSHELSGASDGGAPAETTVVTYVPATVPTVTVTVAPTVQPDNDYPIVQRNNVICRVREDWEGNGRFVTSPSPDGIAVTCIASEFMASGGAWCHQDGNINYKYDGVTPIPVPAWSTAGSIAASGPTWSGSTAKLQGWRGDCMGRSPGLNTQVYVWALCCKRN